MAWMTILVATMAFKYAAMIDASIPTFDFHPHLQRNTIGGKESEDPYEAYKTSHLLEDLQLQRLKQHLVDILLHPDQGVPLIYVEEYPTGEQDTESDAYYNQFPELQKDPKKELTEVPFKRSRYDAENRYMCQPSKDDVFRLLVALHDARQGNSRTVNFCNRRRAATAVFTNIRFLGRKK
ncbi:uncharacterized protein LOC116171899 isoform X2 [Photinus pyralis]|uniref:uncharacterized protein LOC116171899 isoform X2 n=1 Tax=Photinus pyralis TaxID=7054 RepID=UPI0012670D70|nr:uncharacterized protein LOC116171899 isoform X2 [Photinus pyralis]